MHPRGECKCPKGGRGDFHNLYLKTNYNQRSILSLSRKSLNSYVGGERYEGPSPSHVITFANAVASQVQGNEARLGI